MNVLRFPSLNDEQAYPLIPCKAESESETKGHFSSMQVLEEKVLDSPKVLGGLCAGRM